MFSFMLVSVQWRLLKGLSVLTAEQAGKPGLVLGMQLSTEIQNGSNRIPCDGRKKCKGMVKARMERDYSVQGLILFFSLYMFLVARSW